MSCWPADYIFCQNAHNGGSARGYQVIFVPSTALASPRYDGQPAVYLYIVGLR